MTPSLSGATNSVRTGAAPATWLRVLCVLFFFSGFPALIYQLVWQRALFRILGVNIESVTIVVTAFMLGLGIGSILGGWLSRLRSVPLLLLLAAIELSTGAFGLFSLQIFEYVGGVVLGSALPVVALATLALVIVPTLLMGATLPLLVGHLVGRSGHVGESVGLLYYVNTLGAGAACLVCAVALFPWLGMQASVVVAVAINAAVALGAIAAFAVERRAGRTNSSVPNPMRIVATNPSGLPFAWVLVMSCAGGLVSLSYEIFFFRTVSYATGSSPIAFAVTLGAFLIGLASGAREGGEACKRLVGRELMPRMVRAMVLANLVGLLFLPLMSHLAWLDRGILGVALLLVFVLARNWGILLPCLAQLGVPADSRAGMRTAQLYLANIAGAATGSVLTGFVLMDRLSLVQIAQLLVAAGLACTLVLGTLIHAPRRATVQRSLGIAVAGGLALAFLPFASGMLLESLQWKGAPEAKIPFGRVVENRSGVITVDHDSTVFGNGMYDGHFNVDPITDNNGIVRPYALSLFHPAPRDVLMIGFSSGSWAQVIANNPHVESLTIVEINPGYKSLVAQTPNVASVLSNPKVTLITDDGRRWLRMNPGRRFDAIVSNTTYHFRASATNLLSADFLEITKRHLNAGGVAFYNTTGSGRVQRTGCAVFPFGARFTNHMVVSSSPIDWDFRRWRSTLEQYKIDGRPVFDTSRGDDRVILDRWMSLESLLKLKSSLAPLDALETCSEILDRTSAEATVTDDNMGSEWRRLWGHE